jgi:hypothetical protein
MATTKRLRRHAREGALHLKVGSTKYQVLLHGYAICGKDGPDFENDAEMARTWRDHRTELLASWVLPGRRPAAYFKVDLRMDLPRQWYGELAVLESRGLLSKDEELRVEHERPVLYPNQGPDLFNPDHFDLMLRQLIQRSRYLAELHRGEFVFSAEWHERRNRPELAAKYKTLVALIDEAMAGQHGGAQ